MVQETLTIGGDKKRKDKTTILGPYVFRVTIYGQRDDALDMWLLYFERLGVPAAIIKKREELLSLEIRDRIHFERLAADIEKSNG